MSFSCHQFSSCTLFVHVGVLGFFHFGNPLFSFFEMTQFMSQLYICNELITAYNETNIAAIVKQFPDTPYDGAVCMKQGDEKLAILNMVSHS